MSPLSIPCANTSCDGWAEKLGGLCPDCQRKVDEDARKSKRERWRYAGFPKWFDNRRKHHKAQEGE